MCGTTTRGISRCVMAEEAASGIRTLLMSIVRELEQPVDDNRLDSAHRLLDQISRQIIRLGYLNDNNLLGVINTLNRFVGEGVENNEFTDGYEIPFTQGERGIPKITIKYEQLFYLLDNQFSCADIARMLNVSVRTVRRRMLELGLVQRSFYTHVDEQTLDDKVRRICIEFPKIGYRRLMDEFSRQGIRVSRTKARESLRRVDPIGVTERWLRSPIHRRKYYVPAPLSLWHIDGNHKLIRYIIYHTK